MDLLAVRSDEVSVQNIDADDGTCVTVGMAGVERRSMRGSSHTLHPNCNISGHPRLTWGGGEPLGSKTINRSEYIDALRAATNHDIEPLIAFAAT